MNFDFLRVAAVVPKVNVADCEYNVTNIINDCRSAVEAGAKVVVFPELSITSYTCGDLYAQSLLLESAIAGLMKIKESTKELDCVVVVGCPLRKDMYLYNCAVVISKGEILGVVPKTYIPNNNEFGEKRWFTSGIDEVDTMVCINGECVSFGTNLLFVQGNVKIAVEISNDLWATIPPSSHAALNGANVILNLSATNEVVTRAKYVKDLISNQSAKCISAYIYVSAGFGESTTDLVFPGYALIAENGQVLKESARYEHDGHIILSDIDVDCLDSERRKLSCFSDNAKIDDAYYNEIPIDGFDIFKSSDDILLRNIPKLPFVPEDEVQLNERCEEIVNIQVEGVIKRLSVTGIKNVVVGVSGGLDSTLALLVCYKAYEKLGYDKQGIKGVTMPGFGTTDRTYANALDLMKELGVYQKEISIKESVIQHFNDIGHDIDVHDVTYENSQARERTQILMDYSNRCNGLVIGTGDLSELALGWATYNGDHMSMYGVNAGVPKTLVRYLVKWFALNSEEKIKDILLDIVDTPISPELIPADDNGNIKQKTEDLVGPYELHDFFIYYTLRYGFTPKKVYGLAKKAFKEQYADDVIKKWLKVFYRRFFQQQFKRSCLPDGPKVGSVGLSPRGDWKMPSDASVSLWLAECDKL